MADQKLRIISAVFFGIFLEAFPFLVLGVLVSGFIHVFVSDNLLLRVMPRRLVPAVVVGTLLGLAVPVCECGIIAVSRRLVSRGAPVPLAFALILSGPVINPIVIASTWVAFQNTPVVFVGRFGIVLAMATVVALIFGLHRKPEELLAPSVGPSCDCPDHTPTGRRLERALTSSVNEFFEMGVFLVVAGLAAGTLQAFVPRSLFLMIGEYPGLSIVALMALAVLLSVCSAVDAFVALSFVGAFSPGAIVAFLTFGPMVNLKSTLMYGSVFRLRTIVLMIVLYAQFVFLGTAIIDFVFG